MLIMPGPVTGQCHRASDSDSDRRHGDSGYRARDQWNSTYHVDSDGGDNWLVKHVCTLHIHIHTVYIHTYSVHWYHILYAYTTTVFATA